MTPVLFRDRSRQSQVLRAGVAPAVIGALAGVLLGVSAGVYWVVSLVAAIGGFLAGFEHEDARSAAFRGLAAGLIYGAAVLLAHAIAGTHAKVSLGSAPVVLALITAVIGLLLTSGGRLLRAAGDRRRPAT